MAIVRLATACHWARLDAPSSVYLDVSIASLVPLTLFSVSSEAPSCWPLVWSISEMNLFCHSCAPTECVQCLLHCGALNYSNRTRTYLVWRGTLSQQRCVCSAQSVFRCLSEAQSEELVSLHMSRWSVLHLGLHLPFSARSFDYQI